MCSLEWFNFLVGLFFFWVFSGGESRVLGVWKGEGFLGRYGSYLLGIVRGTGLGDEGWVIVLGGRMVNSICFEFEFLWFWVNDLVFF